jgi:Ni,Fe-hydrogenase III large subunit
MQTLEKDKTQVVIRNQESIPLRDIPVFSYNDFQQRVLTLLRNEHRHCVMYYAYAAGRDLKFICCIADDKDHVIHVMSHELSGKRQLSSLSRDHFPLHIFEREIAENHGVDFIYHPWKKPVRYAFNRADRNQDIKNYPFYKIQSDELHEVGVGPIHAGVIEPGHFRFLCNGESVLHLEIQLGWQHRGVEQLYLDKPALLQRTILSESIAGDTSVGHAHTFCTLLESLADIITVKRLDLERAVALELERIAMHIGDLSNMNIGMAYQLGSSVFGALRTPVINYSQLWCGNRFGKGLIRTGGSHYPMTSELMDKLHKLLDDFERRFNTMADKMFALPSVLMRMEKIGRVTQRQMHLIGAVGMAARMAGIPRDLRMTHPGGAYKTFGVEPVTLQEGDVWARAMLRKIEISNSIRYIRRLLSEIASIKESAPKPASESHLRMTPDTFSISMTEGWRGEICHSAVTDNQGNIIHYKVKDPSFHNWFALALSLRNLEISDFPINNKSYNLSYCGHDL